MYLKISLPWPPSVNTYWRSPPGQSPLISKDGRMFRKIVLGYVTEAGFNRGPPTTARLAVHITAYPPDKRRRDLDNLLKALLDALEHAGVYENDSQIDKLSIHRKAVHNGGSVIVELQDLDR